jgi:hypothetical protein
MLVALNRVALCCPTGATRGDFGAFGQKLALSHSLVFDEVSELSFVRAKPHFSLLLFSSL